MPVALKITSVNMGLHYSEFLSFFFNLTYTQTHTVTEQIFMSSRFSQIWFDSLSRKCLGNLEFEVYVLDVGSPKNQDVLTSVDFAFFFFFTTESTQLTESA